MCVGRAPVPKTRPPVVKTRPPMPVGHPPAAAGRAPVRKTEPPAGLGREPASARPPPVVKTRQPVGVEPAPAKVGRLPAGVGKGSFSKMGGSCILYSRQPTCGGSNRPALCHSARLPPSSFRHMMADNPKGVVAGWAAASQPRWGGLEIFWRTVTQGSAGVATLGLEPESRWSSLAVVGWLDLRLVQRLIR